MPTHKFLHTNIFPSLLLITALSGLLATSVIAQGRGNKSSERDANDGVSITHKIETTNGQDNRRGASSDKTGNGTIAPADKTSQSRANTTYRQDSTPTRRENSSEDKSAASMAYQGDRGNRSRQTDRPGVDNRKPELPSTSADKSSYGYNRKNNNPGIDDKQSVDTRNRENRSGTIGNRKPQIPSSKSDTWQNNTSNRGNRSKPNIDSRKPQLPSSHTDSWQNDRNRRDNGPAVTHRVEVDNWNRNYRDRVPAYSQDRDRDHNRYRNHRPPTFYDGRYSYSSRPYYKPSLFGYWAFNDDPGFCRSVYFYYGYFPYMDTVRIHVGNYTKVGYYGRPILFGDVDDYYLASRINSELDYTLSDIRKSWLDGRADLIDNHIDDDQRIAVLLDGKYDYSIEARDYIQMTADAIDVTRTINFTWESLRRRTDGYYTAFGKHTYRDSEGDTKIVYVSYTLRKISGAYYITEVGSSNRPLN